MFHYFCESLYAKHEQSYVFFFFYFFRLESGAGVCARDQVGSKDLTRPSGRDPFWDLTECSTKMKFRKRHNHEPNPTYRDLLGSCLFVADRKVVQPNLDSTVRLVITKWRIVDTVGRSTRFPQSLCRCNKDRGITACRIASYV